jgi:hypothetical protein
MIARQKWDLLVVKSEGSEKFLILNFKRSPKFSDILRFFTMEN